MNTNIQLWVTTQWDRVSAWVAISAGALVLLVGWVKISDKVYPGEQLPYILSAGIGGIFLLGTGAMLWLSADLRDEWLKLDSIEQAIREQNGLSTRDTSPDLTARLELAPATRRAAAPTAPDVSAGAAARAAAAPRKSAAVRKSVGGVAG